MFGLASSVMSAFHAVLIKKGLVRFSRISHLASRMRLSGRRWSCEQGRAAVRAVMYTWVAAST
jgi:hypothetical protein